MNRIVCVLSYQLSYDPLTFSATGRTTDRRIDRGPLTLLGLILPGLRGIRTVLTPPAASGLVIIMIGTTTITAFAMAVAPAVVPMTIGVLAAFVAYGRWRLARLPVESRHPMLVVS